MAPLRKKLTERLAETDRLVATLTASLVESETLIGELRVRLAELLRGVTLRPDRGTTAAGELARHARGSSTCSRVGRLGLGFGMRFAADEDHVHGEQLFICIGAELFAQLWGHARA